MPKTSSSYSHSMKCEAKCWLYQEHHNLGTPLIVFCTRLTPTFGVLDTVPKFSAGSSSSCLRGSRSEGRLWPVCIIEIKEVWECCWSVGLWRWIRWKMQWVGSATAEAMGTVKVGKLKFLNLRPLQTAIQTSLGFISRDHWLWRNETAHFSGSGDGLLILAPKSTSTFQFLLESLRIWFFSNRYVVFWIDLIWISTFLFRYS